jgi:hypothetical protein
MSMREAVARVERALGMEATTALLQLIHVIDEDRAAKAKRQPRAKRANRRVKGGAA